MRDEQADAARARSAKWTPEKLHARQEIAVIRARGRASHPGGLTGQLLGDNANATKLADGPDADLYAARIAGTDMLKTAAEDMDEAPADVSEITGET